MSDEAVLDVLVVTTVHHPEDARIRHRQIAAMLARGWRVTYVAPFTGHGAALPEVEGLTPVDVTRSAGRRRLAALRHARALVARLAPRHDLVLLHDPELLLALPGRRHLPPVVWDVHEDTAAALSVRPWVPDRLRGVLARGVRAVERLAEGRVHLLLADAAYQERFRLTHPVVTNSTQVPRTVPRGPVRDERGRHRVVYLGSVTLERGAEEIVGLGRELRRRTGGEVVVEVIGPAHGPAAPLLEAAAAGGDVEWSGFVPSDRALRRLPGALAGLSLLHDSPNARPSMATKVVEYLAHGVPAITTPLPLPAALVRESGGGVVVPFGDVAAAADVVVGWHARPDEAASVGLEGYRAVLEGYDWTTQSGAFLDDLARLARSHLG